MIIRKLLGVALPLVGAALSSTASSAFDLDGMWATDAALCGKMFERRGGQMAFTELSDLYGSGFVIEGTRIRGKMAQCTIKSKKEDGDSLQLLAGCATQIMQSEMQFSLKIVNENAMSRLFPGMSGMEVTYYRCPP